MLVRRMSHRPDPDMKSSARWEMVSYLRTSLQPRCPNIPWMQDYRNAGRTEISLIPGACPLHYVLYLERGVDDARTTIRC